MICILVLNSLNRVSSERKLSRKIGKFRKTDFAEFREEKNCTKKCKKNAKKIAKKIAKQKMRIFCEMFAFFVLFLT